ncbi:glycoside hydrolase family 20 zincin-like fold domain-containing protein, partial [Streptomyces sp. SID161]|uniref:glycoside hydrolase family 20 zincin-like fold domain-containing protein n=2 Tax=unclassified Streptomyces TaxID=2593676 RepID=UPI0013FC2AD7|nr:beta-N-acetylhexosaminidase [Streptomyces sp. SID161]
MELIPAPRAVEGRTEGGVPLDRDTTLWAGPGTERTERWLRATLGASLGLRLPPGPRDAGNAVRLLLDDALEPEAYRLGAVA